MIPEIKDMKTWDEAEKWLMKHGWGLGLITEQKILWDAAHTKPISNTVAAPKATPNKAEPVTTTNKSEPVTTTSKSEPVTTKTTAPKAE
jgi:hypothetical protein